MTPPPPICYLNSNDGNAILAVGEGPSFSLHSMEELPLLDAFLTTHQGNYIFGYLSYALQSHVTESPSLGHRRLPLAYFWISPEVAKIVRSDLSQVQGTNLRMLEEIYSCILAADPLDLPEFSPAISQEVYIHQVTKIKSLIQRGDLYEANFCFNYWINQLDLNEPFSLYQRVNDRTKAPFSALVRLNEVWLACGSPERFLKKTGNTLISQPIKGTAPRYQDPSLDASSKIALLNSQKERSENVMIVDLVRNDLSKIALPGTVIVDELFGIYSFPTVHQMISTVSSKIDKNLSFSTILKATFPMGSMTGAPKRNALRFMNALEPFSRELYSGSVGYFTPEGDFDFNVVIRSLEYYPKHRLLQCGVGSAITVAADAAREYAECQLKIERLIR
jgi:para-aminobenzoate synthetase component 1